MARLNTSKILEFVESKGVVTTRDLIQSFDVAPKTASTQLTRMWKKKLLTREKGDVNEYNYYLPRSDTIVFDAESMLSKVLDYMVETKHDGLNSLPKHVGGKQTKGSGQLSGYKTLLLVLEDMQEEGLLSIR